MSKKNTESLANLDSRRQLYVKGLSKGLSKRQAALAAGFSESMANAATAKVETPDVKAAFSRLMRRYIPAHRIAKCVSEGLEATETKFFQEKGLVTDQRDVIAWSERRQYAQLAADLGGYATKEKESTPSVAIQVNVEHIGNQSKVTAQAIPIVEVLG